MVPWLSHRSLFSAFLHCIYNPNKQEFLDWIDAAERETWKYIPAIRSHIAEEITLDRCVQRLRQRLNKEKWEKRRTNSYNAKMGDRVPSFFTSPSLVNFGGLGVSDQTVLNTYSDEHQSDIPHKGASDQAIEHAIPSGDMNAGWDGLGIYGNRPSASNLAGSHASGLFIDDEEHRQSQPKLAPEQHPAQTTAEHAEPCGAVKGETDGVSSELKAGRGYVKTTCMANFYYRRSGSQLNMQKSFSEHQMVEGTPMAARSKSSDIERRKSKSQSDLAPSTQSVPKA